MPLCLTYEQRGIPHGNNNPDVRPEWLPDEYEHFEVTREEVWNELDRDARRLFGPTADEFLRIFRNPPEQYHGDVRFRSLCHVADLIAEPDDL